jgi:hypothetical protein
LEGFGDLLIGAPAADAAMEADSVDMMLEQLRAADDGSLVPTQPVHLLIAMASE